MGVLITLSNVEWRDLRIPRPRLKLRRPLWLRRPSEDTLVDVAFVVGLAAIAFGCGWIYHPLAPIVGGVLLVGAAWRVGRAGAVEEPATKRHEVWYSQGDDEDDEG